jgi:hypothetical protein
MIFKYSNKFIKQEIKSNKQRKMNSNNMKTNYKFVDLYKNNSAVGLPFMISGEKFLETFRCGDPVIRDFDWFECKLWGFHHDDNVRTLIFVNDETSQLLHVSNSNRDGKIFTSGFVKGYFINLEMQDNFNLFQQY